MRLPLWVGICLAFLAAETTDAQNLHQLSYGSDTIVASHPGVTTPASIETTTKKKGFFSGIKQFFVGGSSTSTTELPITSAEGAKLDVNGNVMGVAPQSPVVPPQSPSSGQNSMKRDYVNPSLPVSAPAPAPSAVTSPSMPNTRDYVNPNIPVSQPAKPSSPSTGTRDYVNPNLPLSQPSQPSLPPTGNRDYVNPNLPLPQPSRPSSPSTGTRDYVNPNLPLSQPAKPSSPSTGTRDYVNPNLPLSQPAKPTSPSAGTRDYVNPNLQLSYPQPSPSGPVAPVPGPAPPSGTRDYVNPSVPSGPPSGGRDYVNPNLPSSKSPAQPLPSAQSPTAQIPSIAPTPPGSSQNIPQNRRDYVNPNFPPSQGTNLTSSSTPRSITEGTTLNPADFPPLAPPRRRPQARPQTGHSRRPTSPTRSTSKGSVQTQAPPQLATDQELATISESLYTAENSNVHTFVTMNYQGKTYSGSTADDAALPLLQIDERLFQNPTVAKMRALFDNYILDAMENEYVAPNERIEENEFIDAVMATTVMRRAMQFLQLKGIVTADPANQKEMLKTIWFTMYSRGKGKVGSSGFEHVFLAEKKDENIMGLHNWIYFAEQEKKGDLNYKGWIKKLQLAPNNKVLLKYRFDFHNIQKPVNSMFIGTSPELEMALYTICFQTRENSECPLILNGNRFNIRAYSFRSRGKIVIGSAFPEIVANAP